MEVTWIHVSLYLYLQYSTLTPTVYYILAFRLNFAQYHIQLVLQKYFCREISSVYQFLVILTIYLQEVQVKFMWRSWCLRRIEILSNSQVSPSRKRKKNQSKLTNQAYKQFPLTTNVFNGAPLWSKRSQKVSYHELLPHLYPKNQPTTYLDTNFSIFFVNIVFYC